MKSEKGYYVGKSRNLKDKIVAKEIYLGIHDSISNYDEITEEEGLTMIKQKELAESINTIEDIDKAVVIASVVPMVINSIPMSNNESLKRKSSFPEWKENLGEVKQGEKYQCDNLLWEVVQGHITQANWKPSVHTSDIWKIVEKEHEGTLEDPIPYEQGMAFEKGKYYSQYGVTYLCILTTSTGYPYDLKDIPTIVQKV